MFFELQMLNISSLFPPTCSNRSRFSTLYRLGWASKIALTTVVALGSIGLTAGEAHAFVVNVDSQNYDVTTFSGSYNDNISKFNLPTAGGVMPWWNSDATSKAFATAVGTAFGAVNPNGSGTSGPLFAYSFFSPAPGFGLIYYNTIQNPPAPTVVVGGGKTINDSTYVWAQATLVPVPGPLPALGAAAAFGFSRQLRKRIKRSTNAVSSTYCL